MNEKELKIQEINHTFEQRQKEINERREYRMKNYYDCIDDYSWGGICDQADNELEDKYRMERDILIEQVNGNGKVKRTSSFYRLVSNSDFCDGASEGQYGQYFKIDGCFIGVPKKLATLKKKGFSLIFIERTYECSFKTINKYGVVWKDIVLLNEKKTEVQDNTMPEWIGRKPYIDYQFDGQ